MEVHKRNFRTKETRGVSFSPFSDWKLHHDVLDPKTKSSKNTVKESKRLEPKPIIIQDATMSERIQRDIEYARVQLGITGSYIYHLSPKELPEFLTGFEATIRVNIRDVITYQHGDMKRRRLVARPVITFPLGLKRLLHVSPQVVEEVAVTLLNQESLLHTIREERSQLLNLKQKSRHAHSPLLKRARAALSVKLYKHDANSHFLRSKENTKFWLSKGISKKNIKILYELVDYFYLSHDWNDYIYRKLFLH